MNIVEVLERNRSQSPDRAALIDATHGYARTLSYSELCEATAFTAGQLRRMGVRFGTRVLLVLPMSLETYIILLAIFRIGAVAVFPDISQGLARMLESLSKAAPRVIIGNRKTLFVSRLLNHQLRIKTRIRPGEILPPLSRLARHFAELSPSVFSDIADSGREIAGVKNDTPALITFTSGTGGASKGIVRTHGFLLAQHNALTNNLPHRENDVELTTLPVFVLNNLGAGVTTVLPDADLRKPGSADGGRLMAQIEKHGVTRILCSPSILQRLIDHCAGNGSTISGVTSIITGGGPVFPSLISRLKAVAPSASTHIVYGSTEAEPVSHICADDLDDYDLELMRNGHGLLVGRPIDGIALGIIPEKAPAHRGIVQKALYEKLQQRDGAATEPPHWDRHLTGEIVVSGDHVVKGYLDSSDDLQTKFRAGGQIWHRTGDAGYLDQFGRLWLLGRCSAKIEDELGALYPFQVEVAASESESIARATCVRIKGRRILVVERTSVRQTEKPKQLQAAFGWLKFDELKVVPKIPMDSRHESKILYQQLIHQISNA